VNYLFPLLSFCFLYVLPLTCQEKTINDLGYTKKEALVLSDKAADFFEKVQLEDAEKTYLKVIKIEPCAHAYYNLGITYEYLKKYDKAEKAYLKALEIEPYFYSMYSYLAELMILMQKNNESVSYAKIGLSKTGIQSEKFECLFAMSRAYRNLDSCYQSKDCLARSIQYITLNDEILRRFEKHKSKFQEKCNIIQVTSDTTDLRGKEIYAITDQLSSFPGGKEAMVNFITSPWTKKLADTKIVNGGKVFLQFVVNEDGWISNIKIIKDDKNCPECGQEAIRIVSWMPRWEPAKKEGRAVASLFVIPFNFKK
jgi:tetratricopeptide (TPR) repeat protein